MSEPVIAMKKHCSVDVEAGQSYWWCSCGRSASQPFCDGAHKGTDFAPVEYIATETGNVHFCGCKHSAEGPVCDGAHHNL